MINLIFALREVSFKSKPQGYDKSTKETMLANISGVNIHIPRIDEKVSFNKIHYRIKEIIYDYKENKVDVYIFTERV